MVDNIEGVFSLFVVTNLSVFQQNFGNRNTKIGVKSLTYITSGRANKALENQEASVADKLKANLGNHGTNKKRQTTALDVTNKSMKMGMSSKKAVILQKIKQKVALIFRLTRRSLNTMNTFRENIELGNMKNLIHISL